MEKDCMPILKTSYTDVKQVTHFVEHRLRPIEDPGERERLLAQLRQVLGRRRKGGGA